MDRVQTLLLTIIRVRVQKIRQLYVGVICAMYKFASNKNFTLPPPTPQLAKKYHPDRNEGDPNAAKQFTKIGEAYEVKPRNNNCSFNPFATAGLE